MLRPAIIFALGLEIIIGLALTDSKDNSERKKKTIGVGSHIAKCR